MSRGSDLHKNSLVPKPSFRYQSHKKEYDPRAEQIYLATVGQDWATAHKLLQEGAPCDYQSAWGRTALHSALFENHVQHAPPGFFQELLDASKPVINLGTDSGNTALHWACQFATSVEVELLLKAGVDVTVKNKEGFTALDIAKSKHATDILHTLAAAGLH